MKRLFGILAFFCCLICFAPRALAEEIKIDVTASPTEMSEGGMAAFNFQVSNYSDYVISDISISYQGVINMVPLSQPVPVNGSIRDIILNVYVSDSQIGSAIPFEVTCVRNGEPLVQEVTAVIGRSADPTVTLIREASSTTVRTGETIMLTYTLKNDTRYDMTNLTVTDPAISSSPIIKNHDVLYAGSEVTISLPYALDSESVVSAPSVEYTVNGRTKTYAGTEPLTLSLYIVRLAMHVTSGAPTSGGVIFNIDLENTGNQPVRELVLTDERKNPVNTAPFSLAPGETASYSFNVVPVMSEPVRSVRFLASGVDSEGVAYTVESPTSYDVYPYVDSSQISVSLTASTVAPWTSDTGTLTARILIINHSQVELTNVTVTETSYGVLRSYDRLAAGETQFDFEFVLGSPVNLNFAVRGSDPTGAVRDLATDTLPVAYGTETTPEPDAKMIDPDHKSAFSFLRTGIAKILLGLGGIMLLSFVILLVLSIRDRSQSGGLLFRMEPEEDELDDYFDRSDHLYDPQKDREESIRYMERHTTQRMERLNTVGDTGRMSRKGSWEESYSHESRYSDSRRFERMRREEQEQSGRHERLMGYAPQTGRTPAIVEFDPVPESPARREEPASYRSAVSSFHENSPGVRRMEERPRSAQSGTADRKPAPDRPRHAGPKVLDRGEQRAVRSSARNELRRVSRKED